MKVNFLLPLLLILCFCTSVLAQLPGGVVLNTTPCNVVADSDFVSKGAWTNIGVVGTNVALFDANDDSLEQTLAGLTPSSITLTFSLTHINTANTTPANFVVKWSGVTFVTFNGNNSGLGTVTLAGGATCSSSGLTNNTATNVTITIPNTTTTGLLNFSIIGNDDYQLDNVSITGTCDHLFWLKADTGTSTTVDNALLSQWNDQGGVGLNVTASGAAQPKFLANGANFNPTINFSTPTDFMQRVTVQSNFIKTTTENAGFVVANTSSTNNQNIVYHHGLNGAPTRNGIGRTRARFNVATPFTALPPINLYHLLSHTASSSGRNFYWNGASNGTDVSRTTSTNTGRITIGRSTATNFASSDMTGNISEIVNFKRILTLSERERIDTYLAIKYGISLAHNYQSAAGVTLFTSNGGTATTDYDSGIFGIGKELANGNLDQRVAKSSTTLGIITLANGSYTPSPTTKNLDNPNSLANGQFLLLGNNGGSFIFNQINALPGKSILDRKWKVSNIGAVGAVTIQAPDASSPSGLTLPAAIDNEMSLIVKNGNTNFETGATVYPMTFDAINRTWTVGVTLSNNDFFTFQTVYRNNVPGCIVEYTCAGVVNGNFDTALAPSWTVSSGWAHNATTLQAQATTNNTAGQELNQLVSNLDALATSYPLSFSIGYTDSNVTATGATMVVQFGGVPYLTITGPASGNTFAAGNYVLSNGATFVSAPPTGVLSQTSLGTVTINVPSAIGATGGDLRFIVNTSGGSNDDWFLDNVAINKANCNSLWMKAENGVVAKNWTSSGEDGTVVTSTGTPTYIPGGINFNPSVSIDSATDFYSSTARIIDPFVSDFSVLGVFKPTTVGVNNPLFVRVTDSFNFGTISTTSGVGSFPVDVPITPDPLVELSAVTRNVADLTQRRMGTSGSIGDFIRTAATNFQIGGDTTRGEIGEVIVYKKALSVVEYEKIESYLGVKWGITLNHNYVNSSGTVVYDISSYNNNITGIGREDCQTLHQRQSKSVNTAALLTIGNNDLIANTNNTANGNDINIDVSYLITGDDNGATTFTIPIVDPILSASVSLEKKWKVSETGTINSVLLSIPDNANSSPTKLPAITASQALYLIVDSNDDFTSGATQYQMNKVGTGGATRWELPYNFPVGTSYFTFAIGEVCNTVTECVDATIWDGSAWSNGVPVLTNEVIFNANYDSSVSGSGAVLNACEIVINTGVTVRIKSTDVFDIQGNLTNNGTLIIENNGALIQRNNEATITGTGTYSVKRDARPMVRFDYTYWSSPVAGQTLFNLSPTTLADKYFRFDPTTGTWQTIFNGAATMLPGVGYIVRAPQSYNATPAIYSASFDGPLFSGIKSISVTKGVSEWNLVGNPYPSAIDATLFLNDPKNISLLGGTIYLWTHNTVITGNQYTSNDYASYNKVGGVAGGASPAPTGKIAAGQSFFVEALQTGTKTVSFSNCMRTTASGSNSQFFKNAKVTKGSSTFAESRIWLNFTNATGAFKQLLIGYVDGATAGIDRDYDGQNFNGNSFVNFYAMANDLTWTILGNPAPVATTAEVPLGFSSTVAGAFSISIADVQGELRNLNVFLFDEVTKLNYNLKNGPYQFTTEKGTFDKRFKLVYADKTLSNANFEKERFVVFSKDNSIFVEAEKEIKELHVFDLLGRKLKSKTNVNATKMRLQNLQDVKGQLVVVKIVFTDGKVIAKKVQL